MGIVEEYKIFYQGTSDMVKKYPKSFRPIPNADDYARGYIKRYFTKLRTNNFIIEISSQEFIEFKNQEIYSNADSFLFVLISLKWRIIGNRQEVELSNTNILKLKEQSLKKISIKLGNRLEFWKKI